MHQHYHNLKSYFWSGFNPSGEKIFGQIQSPNIAAAKQQLLAQKILLYKIKRHFNLTIFSSKIPQKLIYSFSDELANLLGAGVSIIDALELLINNTNNNHFKNLLNNIKNELENGTSLSSALSKHPQLFDHLFIQLIHIGEESGTLEIMLRRLVTSNHKLQHQKRQLKKVLFYPLFLLGSAILITAFLLIFIVPKFQQLWSGFGATLPCYTQLVIKTSKILQHNFFIFSLSIFILIFLARFSYYKLPRLQFSLQRLFITKVPICKSLLKQIFTTRFTSILATTLHAGLPIVAALNLTQKIFITPFYQYNLNNVTNNIKTGQQLSIAISKTQLLPNLALGMLRIGETSGNLDTMLEQISNHYNEQLENLVATLNLFLEPLVMLILGVIIGAIIIALYLPILQMGRILH